MLKLTLLFESIKLKNSSIYAKFLFSSSVPTFVNMPEETLIKIADVLEEVRSKEEKNSKIFGGNLLERQTVLYVCVLKRMAKKDYPPPPPLHSFFF